MQWENRFEIGIPEIDKQHMIIVECISALEDAVEKRMEKTGWSTVHSVLGQLNAYVRMHFATEEALLQEHGYPQLDRHLNEHLQFTHDLMLFQQKSLTSDVAHELLAFLNTWLREHIMQSDKHYAPFLPSAHAKRQQ